MQNNDNRTSRSKGIALAVALGVLALVAGVWFVRTRQPVTPHPVAPHPVVKSHPPVSTHRLFSTSELDAQIAVVERKVRDIESNRRELFGKMVEARKNAAATNDFLSAEMSRLQGELDAAMDAHPSVVARRNEMRRLLDESHVIDTNSAAVLTVLHEKQKAHTVDFHQAQAAVAKESMEERKKAMEGFGKTDMRKLTPDEADIIAKIDVKFGKRSKDLAAQLQTQ